MSCLQGLSHLCTPLVRKYHPDELGRPDLEIARQLPKLPVVIVLDNVRSALNVGSVFRTCDAFAAAEILLCGITAQPPHREIFKTALGATNTVPWQHFAHTSEAAVYLQVKGYVVWVVEQTDSSLLLPAFQPDAEQKYALVFGNEVHGVSEEWLALAQGAIEVPQWGAKHSLNVAVCTGVVLWEMIRKLKWA